MIPASDTPQPSCYNCADKTCRYACDIPCGDWKYEGEEMTRIREEQDKKRIEEINSLIHKTHSPSPQPDAGKQLEQEYLLITYEELVTIWSGYENTRPILDRIRSRTITPAPEPHQLLDAPTLFLTFDEYGSIKMLLEDEDDHANYIFEIIEKARVRGTAALIQRTREEALDLLTSACSVRAFVDSDGDVHYGSLTLDEIQDILRSQPPTTGSTTSPAKSKGGE